MVTQILYFCEKKMTTLSKIDLSKSIALRFILENPVKRLSQTRAWYRIERRQTYIKPHELKDWYDGVQLLQDGILRDYLLLILFTGLRRREAAGLTWANVDLIAKTLTP